MYKSTAYQFHLLGERATFKLINIRRCINFDSVVFFIEDKSSKEHCQKLQQMLWYNLVEITALKIVRSFKLKLSIQCFFITDYGSTFHWNL